MGYNTAALFLNDAIDGLKTDPNIGQKIYEAIITAPRQGDRYTDFSIGNHCNGGMVLPSCHADVVQVIALGGNYMKPMGNLYGAWRDMQEPEKLLKSLADQMGYRMVKKPSR